MGACLPRCSFGVCSHGSHHVPLFSMWGARGWIPRTGSGRAVSPPGWDVKGAVTLVFCKLLGSAVQLPLTQGPGDTHGHFGWML